LTATAPSSPEHRIFDRTGTDLAQTAIMFERFTDQARRVLVIAQEQARELGHLQIGDELLLFGMAEQSDATAGQVLAEAGAGLDRLRERILPAVGRDRKKGRNTIQDTSRSVRRPSWCWRARCASRRR